MPITSDYKAGFFAASQEITAILTHNCGPGEHGPLIDLVLWRFQKKIAAAETPAADSHQALDDEASRITQGAIHDAPAQTATALDTGDSSLVQSSAIRDILANNDSIASTSPRDGQRSALGPSRMSSTGNTTPLGSKPGKPKLTYICDQNGHIWVRTDKTRGWFVKRSDGSELVDIGASRIKKEGEDKKDNVNLPSVSVSARARARAGVQRNDAPRFLRTAGPHHTSVGEGTYIHTDCLGRSWLRTLMSNGNYGERLLKPEEVMGKWQQGREEGHGQEVKRDATNETAVCKRLGSPGLLAGGSKRRQHGGPSE